MVVHDFDGHVRVAGQLLQHIRACHLSTMAIVALAHGGSRRRGRLWGIPELELAVRLGLDRLWRTHGHRLHRSRVHVVNLHPLKKCIPVDVDMQIAIASFGLKIISSPNKIYINLNIKQLQAKR